MARVIHRRLAGHKGVRTLNSKAQLSLLAEDADAKPTSDSLEKKVAGVVPAVSKFGSYGIDGEILKSFRAKVSFREDGSSFESHYGGYGNLKRLYAGVTEMEVDMTGHPKNIGGIPHSVLLALKPSEILALYIASHNYKSTHRKKETERYAKLSEGRPVEVVANMIEETTSKSYYLGLVRRKDNPIVPLRERLSKVEPREIYDLLWAISLNSSRIKDNVKVGIGENIELRYLRAVNNYIGRIRTIFLNVYGAKTSKNGQR
ncbi:MAG: hypothetical protein AABX00_00540 [Nanoarchaeota archaeon]